MKNLFLTVSFFILSLMSFFLYSSEFDYIWLEGENYSSKDFDGGKLELGRNAEKSFLSENEWLSVKIDSFKVPEILKNKKEALLTYNFRCNSAGDYDIWARIGYEFVRSIFAWRIDSGDWHEVRPDELTRDLMRIDKWCEVAWLTLASENLAEGAHKIEFKVFSDPKVRKGGILFALDAICISEKGKFRPNGAYKPDEKWRSEKDLRAAEKIFKFPAGVKNGKRTSLKLKGLWQVCRFDEQAPGEVAEPIREFPENPRWKGIEIPSDKNKDRPDLTFAHRLWYRTKVKIPEEYENKSFILYFPYNNLNTTVYVNRKYCGFDKIPLAPAGFDLSKAVEPGKINEIWVGIRDPWYGLTADPENPLLLRKKFNFPISRMEGHMVDFSYPVWNRAESGILDTPVLTAAGKIFLDDVFCIPLLSENKLGLEITVKNNSEKTQTGKIHIKAEGKDDKSEIKNFRSLIFTVRPGGKKILKIKRKWDKPTLWWPDRPFLYNLFSGIELDGKAIDIKKTSFGYREWSCEGTDFKLNGVKWPVWADIFSVDNIEKWLEFYKKTNQRIARFWGTNFLGLRPEKTFELFDENGILCRRSSELDGQVIGYVGVERDINLKKKTLEKYDTIIKMDLMNNWREQVVAQVKGERNHPSIVIWSIENEFMFIAVANVYKRFLDEFEEQVTKVADAVHKVDPTRPVMIDGGGATTKNTLPIHGDHYNFEGKDKPHLYPDLAYKDHVKGGGRGIWEWDKKRPRFHGEDFYAKGLNPFDYMPFGGEKACLGRAAAADAAGIVYRMLTEGYRWKGLAGWHFWIDQATADNQYNSNSPRAVFCREWNWTFKSGSIIKRTFKIFNDSRYDDPIRFKWTIDFPGKRKKSFEKEYRIPAGERKIVKEKLSMPRTEERIEGKLNLQLFVKNEKVFEDTKNISVICPEKEFETSALEELNSKNFAVFDPNKNIKTFLRKHNIEFRNISNLEKKSRDIKILLIGSNIANLNAEKLYNLASNGMKIIVLEQKNPLNGAVLKSDFKTESKKRKGRIAFIEDFSHPLFDGLKNKDFFTWAPNHIVYKNPYLKPEYGAKSLIQCDKNLGYSSLLQIRAGSGFILLSQLEIENSIKNNPVAQKLLGKMLNYAADYILDYNSVAVCLKSSSPFMNEINSMGILYRKVDDPLTTLNADKNRIAILSASSETLKILADNKDKIKQFTRLGGWIILLNLSPEGLKNFNKIVGVEHVIRPFRMERVTFPEKRHPLTAGISLQDVVMQSNKKLFDWAQDTYMADDIFTYVLDYDEIAPFAEFPEYSYFNYPEEDGGKFDHNPENMVNGFTITDGWPYIFSLPLYLNSKNSFKIELPKEEKITKFEWIGNATYYPVTKVLLEFDGKKDDTFVCNAKPDSSQQFFEISPPRKAKTIKITLAEWDKSKKIKTNVIGIENIRLYVERSKEFRKKVQPLLNIGALLAYPMGKGGIILNQLKINPREALEINRTKKRRIFANILRNLNAPFIGRDKNASKLAGLNFHKVDLSEYCNQYINEKGWFGNKKFTFKNLPVGQQRFGGVPFDIFNFTTSPLPSAIMLKGKNIPGDLKNDVKAIKIGKKAENIIFLQTAKIIRNNQQIAEYTVNYADGTTEKVPIIAGKNVANYVQSSPKQLENAKMAWLSKYPNTEKWAAAYILMWKNPHPEKTVKSIDLSYGNNQGKGVPALLGITVSEPESKVDNDF